MQLDNMPRLILPAMLLLAAVSVLSFSAPLSVSVSPQVDFRLDANQSAINFTAQGYGGMPFGPNSSSYAYKWTVQKGTYCPGFATIYFHGTAVLPYIPNRTTSACVFEVQASDNVGNTSSATTGTIIVSPQIQGGGILTETAYSIRSGQNSTISVTPPTGGTLPIHYQWLASPSILFAPTASYANSICSVSFDSLGCTFYANASTMPGNYIFQMSYWDSATTPVYMLSNTIIVRVYGKPSNSVNPSSTSTTTSVSTSTVSTTSSTYTTTVAQSVPLTPISRATDIVSDGARIVANWLKMVLGYIV